MASKCAGRPINAAVTFCNHLIAEKIPKTHHEGPHKQSRTGEKREKMLPSLFFSANPLKANGGLCCSNGGLLVWRMYQVVGKEKMFLLWQVSRKC